MSFWGLTEVSGKMGNPYAKSAREGLTTGATRRRRMTVLLGMDSGFEGTCPVRGMGSLEVAEKTLWCNKNLMQGCTTGSCWEETLSGEKSSREMVSVRRRSFCVTGPVRGRYPVLPRGSKENSCYRKKACPEKDLPATHQA